MYKGLFTHLSEHNLFYQKKQFSFLLHHPTKHAIMQLIDQINEKFGKQFYFRNFY